MRSRSVAGITLAAAFVVTSCSGSPTQPSASPPATPTSLTHFEELVGTSWTGTARFTTSNGVVETRPVAMAFIWRSVCDIPGWCATGYSPYGWGTIDGLRLTVMGYNALSAVESYRREIIVGDPTLGTGRWESAQFASDRQGLVITSTDFAWDQRQGVRFELTRAPWPADLACPAFRVCGR